MNQFSQWRASDWCLICQARGAYQYHVSSDGPFMSLCPGCRSKVRETVDLRPIAWEMVEKLSEEFTCLLPRAEARRKAVDTVMGMTPTGVEPSAWQAALRAVNN